MVKAGFLSKDHISTNSNSSSVRMMTMNSFGSLLKSRTTPKIGMTEGDSARSETSGPRHSITATVGLGAEEEVMVEVRDLVGSVQLPIQHRLPSPREPAS